MCITSPTRAEIQPVLCVLHHIMLHFASHKDLFHVRMRFASRQDAFCVIPAVFLYFEMYIYLDNLIADMQNILGLYQQWTNETNTNLVEFSCKTNGLIQKCRLS